MPYLRTAPTWALLFATACTAPQSPPNACVSDNTDITREPSPPPVEIEERAEAEPPRPSEPAPAEQETAFELAPTPWRLARDVLRRGGRGCSVAAELDPEMLVVYSMIDVYALIATGLSFRTPLPELAERPPCIDDICRPNQPNAVLINDDGTSVIDGRAFGFVVPIASGFWVLPLGQEYRELNCIPDIKAETIADAHARLTIVHNEGEEIDCDDVGPDEVCGSACSFAGVTQYDLFFDSNARRTLLVTRTYDERGEFGDPTPAIEVELDGDAVRIDGCRVDQRVPWPPK